MSLGAFQAMEALWVLYAILTYILMALLNIYIPHCMRQAGQKNTQNISEPSSKENKHGGSQVSTSRRYGFAMSIFGTVANFAAGTVMLTMAVILIVALSGTAAQTAGLLITTITGFVTIFGSVVAFFGLPVLPSLPTSSLLQDWKAPVIEFLAPLKDLFVRKDLLFLLISYTIYTDAVFALYSVTGQIFFVTIKPSALEYSLYTLTQYIFCVICILAFYLVQQYWRPFSFESCLIVGYALILVVPAWGCIGLAKNANFGFKVRIDRYLELTKLTRTLAPMGVLRPTAGHIHLGCNRQSHFSSPFLRIDTSRLRDPLVRPAAHSELCDILGELYRKCTIAKCYSPIEVPTSAVPDHFHCTSRVGDSAEHACNHEERQNKVARRQSRKLYWA